jgi:Ca2+/Na+ antiporter
MNNRRAENAFLTVLVILTIISIEKAFIHTTGFFLLFFIPLLVVVMMYLAKNGDSENEHDRLPRA